MAYHKSNTSEKPPEINRAKNRNQLAVESKEPIKAFLINQRRRSSQLVSDLSKKSGSRKIWGTSPSLQMKFRRKNLKVKKKVISRKASQKRRDSSITLFRRSKKVLPKRKLQIPKSSPITPKRDRFSAYRSFMDVHNKEKVAQMLQQIKDPKERRCFLDYVATMRFEKKDVVHKYQIKKNKTNVSAFLRKFKRKSTIKENSEESNSQNLESVNNNAEGTIMDRIKLQKNKLLRMSTQKQPMTNTIIKAMISDSAGQKTQLPGLRRVQKSTQIPNNRQKNCISTPITPLLLKKTPPIFEEPHNPAGESSPVTDPIHPEENSPGTCSLEKTIEKRSASSPFKLPTRKKVDFNFNPKKILIDFSNPFKIQRRESFTKQLTTIEGSHPERFKYSESLVRNELGGSTLSLVTHNGRPKRKASLQTIESSTNNLNSAKKRTRLGGIRRLTSRVVTHVRSGPFNRTRISLIHGTQPEEKTESNVVNYWGKIVKNKQRERNMDMDSPTFAKVKEKVVFSRNRIKAENRKSILEGSEKSLELIFGREEASLSVYGKRQKSDKKKDFHIQSLKKYVSIDTEEDEDEDGLDDVGRMQKQLQALGKVMDFSRSGNIEMKEDGLLVEADQEAEIKSTISQTNFGSRLNGTASSRM